jgi:cytochrome bd-type quinol oxidase subunit 2
MKTQSLLMVTSIGFGLLALIGVLPIVFLPMLFDAPGLEENQIVWIAVTLLWAFPVVVVASILGSWLILRAGNENAARIVAFSPAGVIVLVVLAFIALFSQGLL